ncbi:MAG: hypothetical protein RR740_00025 [Pseudomonas sp.]
MSSIERRKAMEKAAEKQRAKDRERTRPMNPDSDFTWGNTTFERSDYE